MSKSYEITGKIIKIDDIQEFNSGYKKREFIVEVASGKYTDQIKFYVGGKQLDKIKDDMLNQNILIKFNIRGNEWKGSYYVSLQAWDIAIAASQNQEPDEDDELTF